MSERPTDAQYEALDWAATRGGVWKGRGVRADVIERCIKNGWLTYVGHSLSAQGFLVWLERGSYTEANARVIAQYEKDAYIEAHTRAQQAERKERDRQMWRRVDSMGVTLKFNEWFAIMDALGQTASTYRPDHGGVDLMQLRETINEKYQAIAKKKMTEESK